jgi:hypothetical protein
MNEGHDQQADAAAQQAEEFRRSRRLFRLGLAVAAGTLGYFGFTNDVADPLHLYLGVAIVTLAFLPALRWAQAGRYRFPVFEVFMLTTATAYALPLLNGHGELARYAPGAVTGGGLLVVLHQLAAMAAYYGVGARPGRGQFWTEELISEHSLSFLRVGMLLCTAHTYVNLFTDLIPYDLAGPLRAVFSGFGIISSFVMARFWGQGRLRLGDRMLLALLLAAQIWMNVSSLVMITGISTLLLALLGYMSGGRRLPLLLLLPAVALIGILHNGKSEMRRRYWNDERVGQKQVPLATTPAFYAEWLSAGLARPADTAQSKASATLIERASLFHIVCLVVSRTPESQPHLDGQTYTYIPGQFVPRFFWPQKPVGHIATHTIGIYYGLIDREGTDRTTVAIGLLAEAYANFGYAGGALIGAFMGLFFRKLTGWAADSPMFSPGGLLLVVLMAWSFQTELTLSIWLSSMFQAVVSVVALPFGIKRFFG